MISVTALFKAVQADILGKYPDLRAPELEMGSGDANRVAHAFMLASFLRKQQEEIPPEADDAALQTFLRVNEAVGAYSRRPCHEWEEELYGCFKRHLYNFFYPHGDPLILNWNQVVSNGDLGKGANLGAPATDFYTKMFSSSMTVSQASLYELYRHVIDVNANQWRLAEETRISQGYAVEIVNANKLGFVAKNDRTSRTTCTEPTLNMFLQRGISNVVESRLRDYGIDLASQPDLNRELARKGSISGTFSTIDLSSASDSISLTGVSDWIPHNQLAYFLAVRSRATVLPDGRVVQLGMLSTMGNGYTFALQTAIFMCVILAAFEMAGQKPATRRTAVDQRNWGVFGDDIIVPTGAVTRYTIVLLGILGFSVNAEKTFLEGPFRESCGGDFYHGTNVRPVYAKRWSTQDCLYTTYNRLDWWCGKHGELKRVRSLLIKEIGRKPHIVPAHFPDNTGVQVPYSLARQLLPKDPNGSIRTMYLKPITMGLRVPWSESDEANCGTVKHPHKKKNVRGRWTYNSAGLLVAILRGSCFARKSGILIPFRDDEQTRYATRGATVPVWDDPAATREFGYFPRSWLNPSSY